MDLKEREWPLLLPGRKHSAKGKEGLRELREAELRLEYLWCEEWDARHALDAVRKLVEEERFKPWKSIGWGGKGM